MPEQLELTNYGFPVEILKSARKTVSVEITPDLRVIVRVPSRLSRSDIGYFINEKHKWIEDHLEIMRRRSEQAELAAAEKLSDSELLELKKQASQVIGDRVRHFAPVIGVDWGRVTIRFQSSRWGSCSAKGNLNFNGLLALAPPEVLDYVVVHELCHRRELNHSERFWREVERVLPDYRARRRWLRENGRALMARLG